MRVLKAFYKPALKGLFFLLLLLQAGCMVGPNYQKPDVLMPQKFVEEKQNMVAVCDGDFYQWWKRFEDSFLDGLIQEAVKANFDMRLALERIIQARAQFRIRNADLWPNFDFNAVATRSRNSQNFFDSPSSDVSEVSIMENFFMVGFDAVWELDFFGKFRRARRAAYNQWEAIVEDAQNVLISIVSEVALNYVTVRAFQRKIEIELQKIQLDKEELGLKEDLSQAGLNDEIAVESSQSVLERNRANIPSLKTSLKQAIYALAFLLGRQPESLVCEFDHTGKIPCGIDKVPIGLPSDLLRRRPDIKRAERQLAAATEQIGVAVADFFPRISLTGTTIAGGQLFGSTYGWQSKNLNNLFDTNSLTWSVGPSIFWNIIDFGKIRANVAVQNSLQKQALINYEKTVIASLQDVEGALIAYFEEQKRRFSIEEQLASDKRSLQLAQDLFQAGLTSELPVIEAKKKVLDSEDSLIDSEQALTSDLIALYKALGGNWECYYSP